jgi:hypothetical protein
MFRVSTQSCYTHICSLTQDAQATLVSLTRRLEPSGRLRYSHLSARPPQRQAEWVKDQEGSVVNTLSVGCPERLGCGRCEEAVAGVQHCALRLGRIITWTAAGAVCCVHLVSWLLEEMAVAGEDAAGWLLQ